MSLRTGRPGDNWEISISSPTNLDTVDDLDNRENLKLSPRPPDEGKLFLIKNVPPKNFFTREFIFMKTFTLRQLHCTRYEFLRFIVFLYCR